MLLIADLVIHAPQQAAFKTCIILILILSYGKFIKPI